MNSSVNCNLCRHYYITWDARFPYGCRALGFKSKNPPATEVLEASGQACLRFTPKPPATARPEGDPLR